jgi:hypothetical protein
MNNSVVAVLQAAGLYKASGRMAEQTLKTILPDGQVTEHLMSEIEYADLMTMADELDIMIAQENPWIQALFAKNAVAIANAVRVVNVESASGFKGAVGSGRQLDILRFRASQFQDPTSVAVPAVARLSWVRNMALVVPPVGWTGEIICGPAIAGDAVDVHANALTMGTTEAILVFGFANPSWTPGVSAIMIQYLARAYNIQNADFDLAQVWEHFPLIELKEPFILYPREDGRVWARYYQNGADELQPIGLWIKMSQNMRSLVNS